MIIDMLHALLENYPFSGWSAPSLMGRKPFFHRLFPQWPSNIVCEEEGRKVVLNISDASTKAATSMDPQMQQQLGEALPLISDN